MFAQPSGHLFAQHVAGYSEYSKLNYCIHIIVSLILASSLKLNRVSPLRSTNYHNLKDFCARFIWAWYMMLN